MVILDCREDEVAVARVVVDKDGGMQTFFCSPLTGVRLAIAAGLSVLATDDLFLRRKLLFHTPFFEDWSIDLLQMKSKDTRC